MKTKISLLLLLAGAVFIFSCGNSGNKQGKPAHEDAKAQIDAYINQKPPDFFIHKFINLINDSSNRDVYDEDAVAAITDSGYIVTMDTIEHKEVSLKEKENTGKKEGKKEHREKKADEKVYFSEVKVLEKGRPYFIREETTERNVDIHFKAGSLSSKIVSISEPVTDAGGNTTCSVEYKSLFRPNDLYKAYSLISRKKHPVVNEGVDSVKFVKTGDSWKINNDK